MVRLMNDILCGLAFALLATITVCGLLAGDHVQSEIGRAAADDARFYDGVRQRDCASDILRPLYARGEPTPEQVEAAYLDCE
jgi:hypothetical protein